MNKFIQWIKKAIIAGMCTMFLLSVFCLAYTYDGIHISSQSGATDYVWESNQFKSTMKEGFAWLKMDQYGYNNVYDYSENPDILLMGSSHMEALQVSNEENVGALLNSLLPAYRTYNIGMSGHTIYRCVDNLGDALQEYSPQKYVVMVVDSIELSVPDMKSVINDDAQKIPSHDTGIIYYLQKIPSIKTIYKQLSDWISLEESSEDDELDITSEENKENKEESAEKDYDVTLKTFLVEATKLTAEAGVELIIVYQPMQKIENSGRVVYEYSVEKLKVFEKECEKQGIVFWDMTKSFEVLYSEQYRLAHGFSNSSVGEGHLNKYGHRVIANEIASKIKMMEAK